MSSGIWSFRVLPVGMPDIGAARARCTPAFAFTLRAECDTPVQSTCGNARTGRGSRRGTALVRRDLAVVGPLLVGPFLAQALLASQCLAGRRCRDRGRGR